MSDLTTQPDFSHPPGLDQETQPVHPHLTIPASHSQPLDPTHLHILSCATTCCVHTDTELTIKDVKVCLVFVVLVVVVACCMSFTIEQSLLL